jgi:hypothetical protein
MSLAIPDHLHFIWIGPRLPWFALLAMQTALRACATARVTLWASHDLASDPHAALLRDEPRFELARLDEHNLFDGADSALPLDLLARLFAQLQKPAARANIARLLILARFGGVYLDTDTVTLRELAPLRARGAFCGLEHVVWPVGNRPRLHPSLALGGLRELVRLTCALLPQGERAFERVTGWYYTAANNAVLGFPAGHPFLLRTLGLVDALSERERARRYRLGTHLLQQALEAWGAELDVAQLSPAHFYPLGPQISRQYFRPRRDARQAAARIAGDGTYVVHWYASVSELAPYDEARTRAERDVTLFAQLAARAMGWDDDAPTR